MLSLLHSLAWTLSWWTNTSSSSLTVSWLPSATPRSTMWPTPSTSWIWSRCRVRPISLRSEYPTTRRLVSMLLWTPPSRNQSIREHCECSLFKPCDGKHRYWLLPLALLTKTSKHICIVSRIWFITMHNLRCFVRPIIIHSEDLYYHL